MKRKGIIGDKEYNGSASSKHFAKTPRVSIGLPVFNGENYLEKTLDSILAQKYSNFELIISDNASTDRTQQICIAYAAKDKRIRYYRNKRNLGVSKNFNRVFKLSSGEYFKWAAHDDLLTPGFLLKCVNVLDQNPSIVLCHSKTGIIDENGKLVGIYKYKLRFDSKKQHERFGNIIWMLYPTWVLIFGLIRASSLSMTPLFGNYIGSDRNLLAEISLIGRIHEVPEVLFYRRAHPQSYTDKRHSSRYARVYDRIDWWTKTNRLTFPYWKNCLEYFQSVRRFSLKWFPRMLCYTQIVRWFIREGWLLMSSDLVINLFGRSRSIRQLSPLLTRLFRIRRARGGGLI